MIFISSIYSDPIPSSFVKRRLKYSSDTGNGEAKLYLNDDYSLADYVSFFNNYDSSNIYFFLRDSLVNYLAQPSITHAYTSNPTTRTYTNINATYHASMLHQISSISTPVIPLTFEARFHLDAQDRYYIRSYNDIFRETLRFIALPYTTSLRIDKYEYDDNCTPYNFLTSIIPQTTATGTNVYILSLT